MYEQTVLRLLEFGYMHYVLGNLNDWSRSFDIPVPQIEEDIAEVDRFPSQYPELLLGGNRDVSRHEFL